MEKIRCPGCMKITSSGGVCEHCGFDSSTQNAPHQLPIGTVLQEQYQIGRVLGQGGFGITYLGWDLYLDIPVAIKEYYPGGMVMRDASATMNVSDVTGDDGERFRNNRDRFMREAKTLARFSQVHEVVQIRNFFKANNTAYIVMEYVEGITLKQYVSDRGGRLTGEETFAVLGPVIQTLAKVHKSGIVHRDISPDNIMMVSGGAKLLDFGAVRHVEGAAVDRELTKSTEAILKQGYAPIEQYQKKGSLGPWTDVYALCGTIYYCLTGQTPPDAPARVLGYEELELELLSGLTPQQKAALLHGLELRTDMRTGSMEQLYSELFAIPDPIPNPIPNPDPDPIPDPVPDPIPDPVPEPEPIPVPNPDPIPDSDPVTVTTRSFTTEGKPIPTPKPKWNIRILAIAAAGVLVVGGILAGVILGLRDKNPEPEVVIESQRENVVSGDCGPSAIWKLDLDTGVLTVDGVQMHEFYVEEYDEELRRYKAARPWEDYTDRITEVVLSDQLHRVGTASFAHCPNLTKVTFGSKLKEIGGDAFWNTGLEAIDLPASLEVIEWCAFEGTQIRTVSIPPFVNRLDNAAFSNCPNLEKVDILGSISMSFDVWNDCPIFNRDGGSIEGITIWGQPGGIVNAYADAYGYEFQPMGSGVVYEHQGDFSDYPGNANGRWSFDWESGFLRIEGEMPTDMVGKWEVELEVVDPGRFNRVPQAPWASFRDSIKVVYIADGVTRITDNAFANCHNLADVRLPNTLKSIGYQSFLSTNLEEVVIPDSVTDIHSFAFNWCQNLRTVKLPMGLDTLQPSVFSMNLQLERLYAGSATQFACSVIEGQQVTPFNHINEGEEVNPVDENAMPQHLTIYTPAGQQGGNLPPAQKFAEEYGLGYDVGIFGHENAEIAGEAAFGVAGVYWALEDGVLTLTGSGETPFYRSGPVDRNAWNRTQPAYLTQQNEAPWYPFRNEIHTVIVEDGITALNRGALVNMPKLQHVDLGSVEKIYDGAIENCSMTHLELPDSLVYVHEGAIRDCIELRSIHVHNGSEKIDDGIILGCDNLEELRFLGGAENIWPNFDLFEHNYPRKLTIYGHSGSTAQQYAQRSGIPFETIQ